MKKIIVFTLAGMFALNNSFAVTEQQPVDPAAHTPIANQAQQIVPPTPLSPNAFLIPAAVLTALYMLSQLGLRSYSNFVDEACSAKESHINDDYNLDNIVSNTLNKKKTVSCDYTTINKIIKKNISRPFDYYRMTLSKIHKPEMSYYAYDVGPLYINYKSQENIKNYLSLKTKITASLITFLAIPLAILGAGAVTDLLLALTWYRKNPAVKNRNIIIAGLNKIISMFGKQDNQKQPADITNKRIEAIK